MLKIKEAGKDVAFYNLLEDFGLIETILWHLEGTNFLGIIYLGLCHPIGWDLKEFFEYICSKLVLYAESKKMFITIEKELIF